MKLTQNKLFAYILTCRNTVRLSTLHFVFSIVRRAVAWRGDLLASPLYRFVCQANIVDFHLIISTPCNNEIITFLLVTRAFYLCTIMLTLLCFKIVFGQQCRYSVWKLARCLDSSRGRVNKKVVKYVFH